jgi:hypothetical protein
VYALAEALRTEYLAIYEGGLLVQVDDAVLANAYSNLERNFKHIVSKLADHSAYIKEKKLSSIT